LKGEHEKIATGFNYLIKAEQRSSKSPGGVKRKTIRGYQAKSMKRTRG